MKKITAEIELLQTTEKKPAIFRPSFTTGEYTVDCTVRLTKPLAPGTLADAYIEITTQAKLPKLTPGTMFQLYDGFRAIAKGKVKQA